MNSQDIIKILQKWHLDGCVVAANEMVPIRKGQFLILNTDEVGKNGTHWVCIYKDSKCGEFFDSLGKPPEHYHDYWQRELMSNNNCYWYNCTQIQPNNTRTCGEYCIVYIFLRSNNYSLERIVKILSWIDVELFLSMIK